MRDQSAGSSVVTMPPSPPVVMILSWQKDHAPTWPIAPTLRPLYRAPCACAQSSITAKPCFVARVMIGSLSAGQPARSTTLAPRARDVRTGPIVTADILPLSRSASDKYGTAPALPTQLPEA